MEGCQYVIHVDSPFDIWSPFNHDKFVKPAVEGTKAVLEASAKHGVKRVVLTSSTAAVVDPSDSRVINTEESFIKLDRTTPAFPRSKLLMEEAAAKTLKELRPKFDMVTLCPGFMIGPTLLGTSFAEERWLADIVTGHLLMVPELHMTFVDV